uniref:Uncharacterized protein n=1 Tax=Romanomermis culicivorax TaxID=13658 RepID=A0A915KE42_ROMCU
MDGWFSEMVGIWIFCEFVCCKFKSRRKLAFSLSTTFGLDFGRRLKPAERLEYRFIKFIATKIIDRRSRAVEKGAKINRENCFQSFFNLSLTLSVQSKGIHFRRRCSARFVCSSNVCLTGRRHKLSSKSIMPQIIS